MLYCHRHGLHQTNSYSTLTHFCTSLHACNYTLHTQTYSLSISQNWTALINAHTTENSSRMTTNTITAKVRGQKNHTRNLDRVPTMHRLVYPICKAMIGLQSTMYHGLQQIIDHSPLGLLLMVQRHEKQQCTIHCGPHGNMQCHDAGWCCKFTQTFVLNLDIELLKFNTIGLQQSCH